MISYDGFTSFVIFIWSDILRKYYEEKFFCASYVLF